MPADPRRKCEGRTRQPHRGRSEKIGIVAADGRWPGSIAAVEVDAGRSDLESRACAEFAIALPRASGEKAIAPFGGKPPAADLSRIGRAQVDDGIGSAVPVAAAQRGDRKSVG